MTFWLLSLEISVGFEFELKRLTKVENYWVVSLVLFVLNHNLNLVDS